MASPIVLADRLRRMAPLLGPAFVASIAYVDPGNFATNVQAGAEHGYRLLWVVLAANATAMLVQHLSSKLGIATGRSLAELCRDRYARHVTAGLWLQAEAVVIATDLAEFVGAAIALNLLFGVPLLPAGVLTAIVSFGVLGLEARGRRRFERAMMFFLGVITLGFDGAVARDHHRAQRLPPHPDPARLTPASYVARGSARYRP